MIRRPPRSTRVRSSAASDVYKRQVRDRSYGWGFVASSVFAVLALVSFGVAPSVLGASHVVHWFGAVAIVAVTTRLSWTELKGFVVAPLIATALAQVGIAFWQHPGPGP